MTEVVNFKTGQVLTPKEDVVDILEQLLVRAKAGNVVAIAIAAIEVDGGAGSTWRCSAKDALALLGSVSVLHSKMDRGTVD